MDFLDQWTRQLDWFDGPDCDRVLQYFDHCEDVILPHPETVFRPFEWFAPEDTKVVIIGNEPYADEEYASGLAFSVSSQLEVYPRTLDNIFSELELDCGLPPETGSLSGWAQQGVLLLNTSLTVKKNCPGSHIDIGWSSLIDDVIKKVCAVTRNSVFIFWGVHACKKRIKVSRFHNTIIGSDPHPDTAYQGFFGSRPFSKANRYLLDNQREPIDWSRTY